MRVDLARELLKNPRKTIDDIAGKCGFSDHMHFAKVFKGLTGETPGRYRLLRNTSALQSSPRANLQAKILLSSQA